MMATIGFAIAFAGRSLNDYLGEPFFDILIFAGAGMLLFGALFV